MWEISVLSAQFCEYKTALLFSGIPVGQKRRGKKSKLNIFLFIFIGGNKFKYIKIITLNGPNFSC